MSNKNISSFFEVYAHEYDILTNASQREKYHRKEIQAIIDRFKPTSVLDAGCATGLTAKLFAEYSITSVGLDRSRKMIKIAREKYKILKKQLTFTYGDFENLPKSMYDKFDLVVCLGNSISGVGSVSSLRKSLKNFYTVLKPGGSLILQMLNYSVLKENHLFPIRATENNGIVYERFSERRSNRLNVYITRLDLNHSSQSLEIFRHQFDNFHHTEMVKSIKLANFTSIKKYSNLYFTEKFSKNARDLVITAIKS